MIHWDKGLASIVGSKAFHLTSILQWYYLQIRSKMESYTPRQLDASILKKLVLSGESLLSFRAEAFNISNTNRFSAPGAMIVSSARCTVTSTSVPTRDVPFA